MREKQTDVASLTSVTAGGESRVGSRTAVIGYLAGDSASIPEAVRPVLNVYQTSPVNVSSNTLSNKPRTSWNSHSARPSL